MVCALGVWVRSQEAKTRSYRRCSLPHRRTAIEAGWEAARLHHAQAKSPCRTPLRHRLTSQLVEVTQTGCRSPKPSQEASLRHVFGNGGFTHVLLDTTIRLIRELGACSSGLGMKDGLSKQMRQAWRVTSCTDLAIPPNDTHFRALRGCPPQAGLSQKADGVGRSPLVALNEGRLGVPHGTLLGYFGAARRHDGWLPALVNSSRDRHGCARLRDTIY